MDQRTLLGSYTSPTVWLTFALSAYQWPSDHLGPVTTFMASCNGDCSTFQASDGKWFKIDEGGYTNGQWASSKLIASTSDPRHSESFIDLLSLRYRWQPMDLQYPRWGCLWSIRKSIPLDLCFDLTEVTFLPYRSWYAMRSLHFTPSYPNTTQAACMCSFWIQLVFR